MYTVPLDQINKIELHALVNTSAGDETHRKTSDEDDHPTSDGPLQKRPRPSPHDMFEEILQ